MKEVLPNVTVSATSRITATSDGKLAYLCNVKRLSQLFYTGFRYILSPNVRPTAWRTVYEPLANGFVRKYADPLCLLGVGFGANTSYLMGDIDRHSAYHPCNNPLAFERLLATLARIGLTTPVIIQSSESGGIHVYYFLKRDVNTFRLASLVSVTLINVKFDIRDGQLELFPNTKAFDRPEAEHKTDYNRHRLPLQLQGGGQILDRQGNPLTCGVNLNCETQLAAFLLMAKASADGNDIDKIERQLDPVYEVFRKNPAKYRYTHQKDGESERFTNWRHDTETVINLGWTGFHQTNSLLYDFVVYGITFLKLNDENALFKWVFKAVTNADGYKEFCRHQNEIEARIWDWINFHLKKQTYVPYCGYPTRSSDRDYIIAEYKTSKSSPTTKAEAYTRKRVELMTAKINQTVETIISTAVTIPSRIGDLITLIQTTARQKFGAGFSNTTLHKKHYKYIWVKLIATNNYSDIVPVTLNTSDSIVYRPKTSTERAFESPLHYTTDLSGTNLKPIGSETSHRAPSLWSVDADFPSPSTKEADPDLTLAPNLKKNVPLDLDPDRDLGLKHITHNSIHLQVVPTEPLDSDPETSLSPDLIESKSPTTSNSSDSDINPPSIQIQPSLDPIKLDPEQEDLSSDPIKLDPIDSAPSTDPIEPALEEDLSSDPIDSDSIEPSGADLINRPSHERFISIDPDPDSSYPVPIKPDRDSYRISVKTCKIAL